MHVGPGTMELTEHVNHPPPSPLKPWSYLSPCRRLRLNMIVCIYEFLLVKSNGRVFVLHSDGRVTLPLACHSHISALRHLRQLSADAAACIKLKVGPPALPMFLLMQRVLSPLTIKMIQSKPFPPQCIRII